MQSYKYYRAVGVERLRLLLTGWLLGAGIAYLFYRSVFAVLLFSPTAFLYLKVSEKRLARQRKWEFNQQFRQGISSLLAALNAGYSIENAFGEAVSDLSLMYERDADIIQEFSQITRQLAMNKSVEEALGDLAERTEIEDVENFAEIFQTAKRTGGDIMKIIAQTGKHIEERIEVQREMETVISQKKFEAKIMSVVPLGIILYMWVASPGFLDGLYHNIMGIILMSIMLIAYGFGYWCMQKLTDIRL